MNERFYALPEQKQRAILRAAMEVFAKYDYKHASTDLIAAKARISKGLLFYYFRNKKELYMTVYDYAKKLNSVALIDETIWQIDDFFELIAYAGMKKLKMMAADPYILEFSLRAFYSEREDVSDALKAANTAAIDESFGAYFGNIDFSKFKADADPERILRMLVWLMDGYLHERQMQGKDLCLEEIERELERWMEMFKKLAYKEEYL